MVGLLLAVFLATGPVFRHEDHVDKDCIHCHVMHSEEPVRRPLLRPDLPCRTCHNKE